MAGFLYGLFKALAIRAEKLRSRGLTQWLRAHGAVIGEGVAFAWGARVSLGRDARLTIGAGSRLDRDADLIVQEGAELALGEGVYIGKRTIVSAARRVLVGSHTMTAHQVTILDSQHEFRDPSRLIKDAGARLAPIEIGCDCWLGANTTILAGVTLGDRTVVAAHAVVTRPFPDGGVIGGLPAAPLAPRA